MPKGNNKEFSRGSFKYETGPLRLKERRVTFWFCIVLVIVGIILASISGNQWWLALLLGPFSVIVAAIYAKRGDT